MHLLSVRFHLNELNIHNLTKEEAYQKLTDYLTKLNITPYREGLYHCQSEHINTIERIQHQILENDVASQLIKNFDIVHIDETGNYSYTNFLHQEHIYIK